MSNSPNIKSEIFQEIQINGEGVPEVHPVAVDGQKSKCKLVDVRRPDEFNAELGHIAGATLSTLESNLENFLNSAAAKSKENDTYVFVCRSGGRSSRATQMAQSKGFKKCFNMAGGMIAWNALGLQTETK